VPAIFCFYDRLVEKIGEIIDMPVCLQDYVAAASAIAAIRPAFRHKFLPPKTDAPAPALSCLRKNFDSIDKHGFVTVKSVKVLKR
jgi:hypothetical protein